MIDLANLDCLKGNLKKMFSKLWSENRFVSSFIFIIFHFLFDGNNVDANTWNFENLLDF